MNDPGSDTAAFYDQMWQSYGHLDADSPAAFHRRRLVVALARRAAPGARRILDVGVGQGELLSELRAAFPRAKVSGSDLSQQSLQDARRRDPDADLFQLDLAGTSFRRDQAAHLGKYDLVVCSEVLEHVPEEARALEHLALLLGSGGVLVVTVPGGKMSRFDELIGHQRHYRAPRLKAALEHAGFHVERVLAWGFPFHSFYRSAVRIASRAALPKQSQAPAAGGGGLSRALGSAYSLFGKALKPLFFLNLSRFGEQMLAVARKP